MVAVSPGASDLRGPRALTGGEEVPDESRRARSDGRGQVVMSRAPRTQAKKRGRAAACYDLMSSLLPCAKRQKKGSSCSFQSAV